MLRRICKFSNNIYTLENHLPEEFIGPSQLLKRLEYRFYPFERVRDHRSAWLTRPNHDDPTDSLVS